MWEKQQSWFRYFRHVDAVDFDSALQLALFLRKTTINRSHAQSLTVLDMNNYRVVDKPNKVRAALAEHRNTPFVFFVGRN